VTETLAVLREFGDTGSEGLVLWVGNIVAQDAAVERIVVPPQRAVRSEGGVGYFVSEATLVELNNFLSTEKLRLLGQVHSHPGRAYHSDVDDRFALVTASGGLSLVVPDFGYAPAVPHHWAVYRLADSQWVELDTDQAAQLIHVV
jgi:proteasome lid subunit RPN8/RPN11